MTAVARHLPRTSELNVLDLGCGVGRFSPLLADAFGGTVFAVDPSRQMLAEAERNNAHPSVQYMRGAAEAIPAADGSIDFAFLSMMIHHVGNQQRCAEELRRVLKPNGRVFVRNSFSGRLDSVAFYAWFPEARAIDEARLPRIEAVCQSFQQAGFSIVAIESIEQQIDTSLEVHFQRLQKRAISTFEFLTDEQIEAGFARMRPAVDAEDVPQPVMETIDLIVLCKP